MRVLDYHKLAINIKDWIKDFIDSANADGVVVGLSGGIDSAVTAALCVNALGNERVIGLGLPCESLTQDLEDSKLVASKLGIELKIIDLTECYHLFLDSCSKYVNPTSLPKANVKPRLRMITLYYVAQSKGNFLVAGTGNRAELAIGYFTKYGDAGVDFEPLGNLYKFEVRELAKVLEIPEKIIKKPPSPGLWPGQTDEGEIGLLYDTVDEILYRMDYNLDFKRISPDKINKVKEMMFKSKHKLNMPPKFWINEI